MADSLNLLPWFKARQDVFDYLDGHSVKTADGLAERNLTGSPVKTLMLESAPASSPRIPIERVLESGGLHVNWLDEQVGLVSSIPSTEELFAVLELIDDRHLVLYTLLKTHHMARFFNPFVRNSPWLDRLWISAPMFEELWKRVQLISHPDRFTRLKFDYEPFYEVSEIDSDLVPSNDRDTSDSPSVRAEDRRASTFNLVDRVSTIQQKLPGLQSSYGPLRSFVQLRIPGQTRGGHDFYFDGRVTNRSDSFYDHRANVRDIIRSYRRATEESEKSLWWASGLEVGVGVHNAVLTIRFSQQLRQETFERWMDSTFVRHGRFRLSGRVFRTGQTRAVIAVIDQHLWQPFEMEVSVRGITALIPKGTCGNTVHRLVTNIQRYLDPAIEVWLGETSYRDLVSSSFRTTV